MRVNSDFLRQADLPPVVIIGTGPAGMTLALSLEEKGIDCLLVEGGDEFYSEDSQSVYEGKTFGDEYFALDETRLRQFGGSSNHWTGLCRPLDAADFEARPELGVPGWPIKKTDLDPYDMAARDILEIGQTRDFEFSGTVDEIAFAMSPPVIFSQKYGDRIDASRHIHLSLNTSLISLVAEGRSVTHLELADAAGNRVRLSPRLVVVACGGLENSRLLLWSNEVSGDPVVAEASALGRYWMEHPHFRLGDCMLNRPLHRSDIPDWQTTYFNPRAEVMHRHGGLGFALEMPFQGPDDSLRGHMRQIGCRDLPAMLEMLSSVRGKTPTCGYTLTAAWEQAPDVDNRIVLSKEERDRFNVPRLQLHWRKTAFDLHTAKVGFELVARDIVAKGIGAVRAYRHLIDMENYTNKHGIAGHHHMGGTRMSDRAAEGVVDRNLKIHGMSNAYVLGSSVFPRAGHANPTFTIVQLALRMADHLAKRII
ncbi:GMC family oxidoreductase [Defluviimonas sp. WL0050]|uniref:GMC family oxidoreductase n=1 Tax=Albidovulum litorale TaxID=2984134 RepID=A0ABT2ZR91_9RHOB|nr:GMC family oxidoreductase [Defluviimonas sp. WL0050]MCV2873460.1 GMC family oxidoreductase [Defluviimonas sp. WL0050]